MTHAAYQPKKQDATMSEYIFGKVQPQALDLEEAVLGAIMIERDALPGIIDLLKPGSFYREAHQHIYRACVTLFGKGEPIDILTVTEQLRKDGHIESIGGSYYLVELTNRVASGANLEFHARIVAQKALQRDVIQVATNAIRDAHAPETDAFELLYKTQKQMFDLANFGGRMAEQVGRIGLDVIKTTEKATQAPEGVTGVPSGMKAIDKTTGGWQPSDLIIIAARPGMGKTGFVLTAALNAARDGIPVALFSLEMGKEQLVQRLIAMGTGLSGISIRKGRVSADDLRRMSDNVQALSDVPLYIDDTPGINAFELRAKCRRLKMQHDIQMVIVDYLQLMSGPLENNRNGNREQEISGISRALKNMAKELGVPVIALSQLSRAVEIRGGSKRPQLSDLRESGAIEQDSDLVSFIYRPEYYGIMEDEHGDSLAGVAEFIIAKHRHGALDTIGLTFDGPTTGFSDQSARASNTFAPTAPPPVDYSIPASARPNIDNEDIPF